nr:uncharacterized protein LOC131131415 isoform X2 [Doryrhamphus excisus]
MDVLFGVLCFMVSTCLCFSPQSGYNEALGHSFKDDDSNNSYRRRPDPQTFSQFDSGASLDANQDFAAARHGVQDKWHRTEAGNNKQENNQHGDSGLQHPLDLLMKENTKDTSVEGISFPDMSDFKRLIETMKNSFLTPGQNLEHFQTARGLILNELVSASTEHSKEESVHDDDDDDDDKEEGEEEENDIWSGPQNGQSQKGVSFHVPSQVPDPALSTSGISPRMNKNSDHSRHYPGQKPYPSRSKNRQLPAKNSLSSTATYPPVKQVNPALSESANGSSIKFHNNQKTPSYSKSLNVKPPRGPIASWVYMPDGESKHRMTAAAPVTAKVKESGGIEVNPGVRQPVDFSAERHTVKIHAKDKAEDLHNGRFKSEKTHGVFKPSIYGSSNHKGLVRGYQPLLDVEKPDPHKHVLYTLNQETQKQLNNIPIPISQGFYSVQQVSNGYETSPTVGSKKLSRNFDKHNTTPGWYAAPQRQGSTRNGAQATKRHKLKHRNRIYRLPIHPMPTAWFQKRLPVYRDPKKALAFRTKYVLQSRSGYIRSKLSQTKSHYTPHQK